MARQKTSEFDQTVEMDQVQVITPDEVIEQTTITVDFDDLFSSTYDTYCVTCTNMVMSGDGNNIIIRVKIAGSAKTDANYKHASTNLDDDATHGIYSSDGTASIRMDNGVGTGTGENGNFIFYI